MEKKSFWNGHFRKVLSRMVVQKKFWTDDNTILGRIAYYAQSPLVGSDRILVPDWSDPILDWFYLIFFQSDRFQDKSVVPRMSPD